MTPLDQSAYISLRDFVAQRAGRLVAWTGSGASAAAGLPTWRELGSRLAADARNKAASLDERQARSEVAKIEKAVRHPNPWVTFSILRSVLGEASFASAVRSNLQASAGLAVPAVYRRLWQLPIDGMLTLNLDLFATRACIEEADTSPTEFTHRSIGDMTRLLSTHEPFVGYLHGKLAEESSWVLTNERLSDLLGRPDYTDFLGACAMSRTLLLVGISADDVAVGGHLQRLLQRGSRTGPHYWITDRLDAETDRAAERVGIRVIRYNNGDGTHAQLDELFADLVSYAAPEVIAPPVVRAPEGTSALVLPSPEELTRLGVDEARESLNGYVASLLGRAPGPDEEQRYREFARKYGRVLSWLWYVSTDEPENMLFGHRLTRALPNGAFGRVFEAMDPDGERRAVKVLRDDARVEPAMLHSFRRGVRALDILDKRGVAGIVPYRLAAEIPACVVMDYVDGPTLGEAVSQKRLPDWDAILRVSGELAGILRRAHGLPEHVLHRDVRPPNVMLEGFYSTPNDWRVVVLDFDLAWHRGATEMSIIGADSRSGYLAPEQLNRSDDQPTRSSSVDSYGYAMTLFYMCGTRHPNLGEHQYSSWHDSVVDAVGRPTGCVWRSLPNRIARLILRCTAHRQEDRLDMTQISDEISLLQEANLRPDSVQAASLWAEELAARILRPEGYSWNAGKRVAVESAIGDVSVEIGGLEPNRAVAMRLTWARAPHTTRGNARGVQSNLAQAKDALQTEGWTCSDLSANSDRASLMATVPVVALRSDLDRLARAVGAARRSLER